jgi:hypothetical protein
MMTKEQLYGRINSTYRESVYKEISKISDNIDFSDPRFFNRQKRNRSLGSAQAFIVELALSDERFIEKLRTYMVDGGRGYIKTNLYINSYK